MSKISYPNSLSDEAWALIEPHVTSSYPKGGRPVKHSKRIYVDALLYWLRTGCQWRYLPHDFPHWKSVYTQFRRWQAAGLFAQLTNILRVQVREHLGRNGTPSVGIVDSQSVKTSEMGRVKGYDGAKKIKGRKRHIMVDSQGVLLTTCVSPADDNDRKGLAKLMEQLSAKGLVLKKNLR